LNNSDCFCHIFGRNLWDKLVKTPNFLWNKIFAHFKINPWINSGPFQFNSISSQYNPFSGQSHACKTAFDQLKPIKLSEMQVPKVHKGRFLVCKTIREPFSRVATTTLVQDLNSKLFLGFQEHVYMAKNLYISGFCHFVAQNFFSDTNIFTF
jgi:hypothetical protein